MVNLETFFRLHFDSERISDDRLNKFAQDHIQRLIANNPKNQYAQMINDTVSVYDAYFGAIKDERTAHALQEARTILADNLMDEFKDTVSQKEGIIRGTYGIGTPTYKEFFPHGVTEYRQANKANIQAMMGSFIDAATAHIADLGQAFVDLFVQLRDDYVAVRTAQLNQIGLVEGDKTKIASNRDVIEIQLNRNLLLLALDCLGKPDMVNDYFDQSIIPKWASGASEGCNGSTQETIAITIKQDTPTPFSIDIMGASGEKVDIDWGNNTSDTVIMNGTFISVFHTYVDTGNYMIRATAKAAAFVEVQALNGQHSSINLPLGINMSGLTLNDNQLTSLHIPDTYTNLTALSVVNNDLDRQSINLILTTINDFGTSNGVIYLNGGNNEVPTGQGVAARNQLISRGWMVITN